VTKRASPARAASQRRASTCASADWYSRTIGSSSGARGGGGTAAWSGGIGAIAIGCSGIAGTSGVIMAGRRPSEATWGGGGTIAGACDPGNGVTPSVASDARIALGGGP
jgi:hypothetical protein